MNPNSHRKPKKRKTLAGQLRFIADHMESETPRFAAVIRTASKELYEVRWENGQFRRRLNLKARKEQ